MKANDAKCFLSPGIDKKKLRTLLAKDFKSNNVVAVVGCAHQECSHGAKILEARRAEIQRVWKESDHTGIALQHAFVENRGYGKVLAPQPHSHHEVEICCKAVTTTALAHAIIGDSIWQHAVFNLLLEPVKIEDAQTSSDQTVAKQDRSRPLVALSLR